MCCSGHAQGAKFAVYLDYGIDCFFGKHADLRITERGIIFRSRWRFPLGTQLALRICARPMGPEDCAICQDLTGIVVSCERVSGHQSRFEATILLLDVTRPVQQELGRVANRLELASQLN
jgi:hypothetical protein